MTVEDNMSQVRALKYKGKMIVNEHGREVPDLSFPGVPARDLGPNDIDQLEEGMLEIIQTVPEGGEALYVRDEKEEARLAEAEEKRKAAAEQEAERARKAAEREEDEARKAAERREKELNQVKAQQEPGRQEPAQEEGKAATEPGAQGPTGNRSS